MPKIIELAKQLCTDVESGSSQIATKLLLHIAESTTEKADMLIAFEHVCAAHPDMAILKTAAKILERVPETGLNIAARELLTSIETAPKRIGEHLARKLEPASTLLTYSHSGTVENALPELISRGRLSKIIVSEARPDLEGRVSARAFSQMGVPTIFTIDCALSVHMEGVSAVIIGADAVTGEYIVNKTGTLFVALLANYFDLPIYVLCSTHKFVPSAKINKLAESAAIWANAPSGIAINVPLYERIPIALVSAVICERGLLGNAQIQKFVE